MEVGEKAGDESDTERGIPEGEEEENIQGQTEGQQVDPCGSSNAPSGLSCTTALLVAKQCHYNSQYSVSIKWCFLP